MLNSVGGKTTPWGKPALNWRCMDVWFMYVVQTIIIVPGMLVCSRNLINVCMFIVSKALLVSSATVTVRAGEVIWLNLLTTVLFNVRSAVTVECCVLYPCCVGVFAVM